MKTLKSSEQIANDLSHLYVENFSGKRSGKFKFSYKAGLALFDRAIIDQFLIDSINNYLSKIKNGYKLIQFEDEFAVISTKYLFSLRALPKKNWTQHSSEIKSEATIPLILTKIIAREIIEPLNKNLEQQLGIWIRSHDDVELINPFRVYQSRTEDWTASYVDWKLKDGSIFCFEFAIYPEDNQRKQGIAIVMFSKRKSKSILNFLDSQSNTLLDLLKEYDNENSRDKARYVKYIEIEYMELDSIEKIIISEFKKIKPLLNKIFSLNCVP
jgi:hypothetical protein